jgi:hypothetical protein
MPRSCRGWCRSFLRLGRLGKGVSLDLRKSLPPLSGRRSRRNTGPKATAGLQRPEDIPNRGFLNVDLHGQAKALDGIRATVRTDHTPFAQHLNRREPWSLPAFFGSDRQGLRSSMGIRRNKDPVLQEVQLLSDLAENGPGLGGHVSIARLDPVQVDRTLFAVHESRRYHDQVAGWGPTRYGDRLPLLESATSPEHVCGAGVISPGIEDRD